MRKFWVVFDYDSGRQKVSQAMTGPTARHVAAEIREKHRDARIESIFAIGDSRRDIGATVRS